MPQEDFNELKPKQRDYVCIMPDAEKASQHYLADLRHAAWEAGIPRRKWVDVISAALRDFEGDILDDKAGEWICPNIDDAFGEDHTYRWVSNFASRRGEQNAIKPFQTNISARITLIDLFFRLVYPERAMLFGIREVVERASNAPSPDSSPPAGPSPGDPPPAEGRSPRTSKTVVSCMFVGLGVITVPMNEPAHAGERCARAMLRGPRLSNQLSSI